MKCSSLLFQLYRLVTAYLPTHTRSTTKQCFQLYWGKLVAPQQLRARIGLAIQSMLLADCLSTAHPNRRKAKKRAGLRQLIEKVAVRRCLKTRYCNGLCKKNLEFPVMGFRTSREGKKIHTWLPAHCVLFLQGLGYWEKRNAASKSFQISLTERHS